MCVCVCVSEFTVYRCVCVSSSTLVWCILGPVFSGYVAACLKDCVLLLRAVHNTLVEVDRG